MDGVARQTSSADIILEMKTAVRILPTLLALLFVLMGLRFMFAPEAMAEQFKLAAVSASGLSSLRGVLGGFFLGLGLLLSVRLLGKSLEIFVAIALVEGLVVVGRVVSLIIDGSSPEVWPAIAIESVAAVALVSAGRVLPRTTEPGS